eukprot:1524028-Amphidinium_carterae.1
MPRRSHSNDHHEVDQSSIDSMRWSSSNRPSGFQNLSRPSGFLGVWSFHGASPCALLGPHRFCVCILQEFLETGN